MKLQSTSSLPQGAEIKIPGVGVTPVAVSTKLPAAVAQLTQQGKIGNFSQFIFHKFLIL